jgi:hypothetical protein
MNRKTFAHKILILLYLVPLFCVAQDKLTQQIKKQTIDTLCSRLPERYAYKEVSEKLANLLQKNLNDGKYSSLAAYEDFSKVITNDLRSLNNDKHLALNYDPQQTPPSTSNQNAPQRSAAERAKNASLFNRQMNYGFKTVTFYPGNIGYIKFDYFDAFPEYSKSIVDASFGFLKNADAIILDLRENTGGASAMVSYIAGFFFDTVTLTGTSYNRYTDSVSNDYVQPAEINMQLLNIPLYILTGSTTISGAEALAYVLKYQKKAVVIGEISAGAANPGRVTRLNKYFTAFIPNRHSMNVVTKTSWEGTGVPVDIMIPATEALLKARTEALISLRNKTTDTVKIKKFNQYIDYVQALKKADNAILPGIAKEYIGKYDDNREIIFANGKLFYKGALQAGGEMVHIKGDLFMTEEGSGTIQFVRNTKRQITALIYTWALLGNQSTSKKLK